MGVTQQLKTRSVLMCSVLLAVLYKARGRFSRNRIAPNHTLSSLLMN